MKENTLELVFILDRSGSMNGLETDTIGGFNSILEKHKTEGSNCTVTTVLFDDHYEILHDRQPIQDIQNITEDEYFVRGQTALLDAIGKTINSIGNTLHNTDESERPSSVLFVIITDGQENASREFSYEKIKEMIEHQQEKYSWTFLFIGANIDAIAEASRMGISANHAVNYHADRRGTEVLYKSIGRVSHDICLNESGMIEITNWKKDIEKDYEERKGKKKTKK